MVTVSDTPTTTVVTDTASGLTVTWANGERFWVTYAGEELATYNYGFIPSRDEAVTWMQGHLERPDYPEYAANGWRYFGNGVWSYAP